MRLTFVPRLAVALLLGAAVAVGGPVASASAAGCPSDDGVTVVVDFNQLGGGVQQACADSGGDAASLFSSSGFPLTYAQRQPGFVCRVSGVPASDPCVNTSPSNAYWSLYWSDGRSGRWAYSSTSAGSLRIPDGGYVAFSWKQGSAAAPPSAPATPRAAPPPSEPAQESSSDTKPRDRNGDDGRGSNNPPASPSGSASASASVSPSAEPSVATQSDKGGPKGKKKGTKGTKGTAKEGGPAPTSSVTPSTETEADTAPTAAPPAPDDDGLPGWVAPALIVLLFMGAGAAVVVRRRGAAGQ